MREKAIFSEATNLAAAEAKGEAKGKAEAICQYMETSFGMESQALQETVRTLADLDMLNRIINRIFTANNLDEAKAIIQED